MSRGTGDFFRDLQADGGAAAGIRRIGPGTALALRVTGGLRARTSRRIPMNEKKALAKASANPFDLLRQMTSELDRMFEDPWTFRWPALQIDDAMWAPKVDVIEKDNRLDHSRRSAGREAGRRVGGSRRRPADAVGRAKERDREEEQRQRLPRRVPVRQLLSHAASAARGSSPRTSRRRLPMAYSKSACRCRRRKNQRHEDSNPIGSLGDDHENL